MSMSIPMGARRGTRSRIPDLLLAAIALTSAMTIEALHGHACTGDGCMLCLVAGWAHVLLGLCMGITFARPVLRAVAGMRPTHGATMHVRGEHILPPVGLGATLTARTPVTMGTRLLI